MRTARQIAFATSRDAHRQSPQAACHQGRLRPLTLHAACGLASSPASAADFVNPGKLRCKTLPSPREPLEPLPSTVATRRATVANPAIFARREPRRGRCTRGRLVAWAPLSCGRRLSCPALRRAALASALLHPPGSPCWLSNTSASRTSSPTASRCRFSTSNGSRSAAASRSSSAAAAAAARRRCSTASPASRRSTRGTIEVNGRDVDAAARGGPRPVPRRAHRLRVSNVQPAAGVHGAGKRHAGHDVHRRPARRGASPAAAGRRGPGASAHAQAAGPVGRRAAARRRRPGAGQSPGAAAGRRADGQRRSRAPAAGDRPAARRVPARAHRDAAGHALAGSRRAIRPRRTPRTSQSRGDAQCVAHELLENRLAKHASSGRSPRRSPGCRWRWASR